MITVIIPALNEAERIAKVIAFAKQNPYVSEVIVVDDNSSDETASISMQEGAKVMTSTKLGKGSSMLDGLRYSINEILVFLDGDIDPYPANTIMDLVSPILHEGYDFVKSAFSRNAGRVTEMVAKPLLSIFFPDLTKYSQPLSGMIAAKKSMLQKLDFKDDYGVDIGLLIDAYIHKFSIKEVCIGYIENKSKPWRALSKMSKEVAQTIISKASLLNNPIFSFDTTPQLREKENQMESALRLLPARKKIVLFDMDHTLLKLSFIQTFCQKKGLTGALQTIQQEETELLVLIKRIATLLKGCSASELTAIVEEIPVIDDAYQTIRQLKANGYLVGIVSHSFDYVTNHIKTKLGMDFSFAHELEFSKGICTGEVKIPSFFFHHSHSTCAHSLCKSNVLDHFLKNMGVVPDDTVAVGDSIYDLCMIKNAGTGISFCSKDELVVQEADLSIDRPAFKGILDILS